MTSVQSWRVVLGGAALMLVTGCGEEEPPIRDATTPISSASAAVACSDPTEGTEQFDLERDPQQALSAWASARGARTGIEAGDLLKSVEQVGRVLYVQESQAGIVAAVVAGRRVDDNGDTGWAVSSWARCPD